MTDLVVRKIPWEFDATTVPFLWQPGNPNFSAFCDVFTFSVVPFERYLVSVVRRARDRFADNGALAVEMDAFLRQEASHSAAHRKHMLALIGRYPELERCYEDACASYDGLLDEHPIEFHAAYIANLELVSQALYKLVLDNRDALTDGCDPRVASLIMWHFIEEIEHRSSGLKLCQHINAPWYRVRHIRRTLGHWTALSHAVAETFDEVVPLQERGGVSAQTVMTNGLLHEFVHRLPGMRRRNSGAPWIFHGVPMRRLVAMLWGTLLTLTPHHDPAGQSLPEWTAAWMRDYQHGMDMTMYFGTAS